MKYILLFFCCLYMFYFQTTAQNKKVVENTHSSAIDANDTIYHIVEKMPEYPGGHQALVKYIAENLKYPITDVCYEGRVYIRFIIDEEGNVKKPEVVRGVESLLDNEAIRVVKTLPRWAPGEHNGKRVKVWYTLPIFFEL